MTGWSCGEICRFPTRTNTLLIPVIIKLILLLSLLSTAIRVGGIKQSCVSDVCLSVAYIVSNSRTQRPWKTNIGTELSHVTCDPGNSFEVKRSPHRLLEFNHSFFHSYMPAEPSAVRSSSSCTVSLWGPEVWPCNASAPGTPLVVSTGCVSQSFM